MLLFGKKEDDDEKDDIGFFEKIKNRVTKVIQTGKVVCSVLGAAQIIGLAYETHKDAAKEKAKAIPDTPQDNTPDNSDELDY